MKKIDRNALSAIDLYAAIKTWWGEPLSADLAKRIINAPRSHRHQFAKWLHLEWPIKELPDLAPGTLRPFIVDSYMHDRTTGLDYFSRAARLLLFTHEVLVTMSTENMVHMNKDEWRDVLNGLCHLRPLADSGAIHFLKSNSWHTHPASTLGATAIEKDSDPPPVEVLEAWDVFKEFAAKVGTDEANMRMFHFRITTGFVFNVAARWPGKLQSLAISRDEEAVMRIAFRSAMLSNTLTSTIGVRHLATLDLPALRPDVKALTELRQSDEVFADWRKSVADALTKIDALAADDDKWLIHGGDILYSELEPTRARLNRVISKSPFLSSLETGLLSFTYSGIGALAGAGLGGSLGTSIAGGATAKAAEALVTYIKAVRERRRANAILDLMLTFTRKHP